MSDGHVETVELVENQGWDERIIVLRNEPLVDVFLIITERYVVVVDTLINPTTARKMMDVAEPYLQGKRSLLVVNTHSDYDHAWGNQIFAGPNAEYPAPIIGHRTCVERFRLPESAPYLEEMQGEEPNIFGDVVLVPPTVQFEEKMVIEGGDLTIELFPAMGHTPDHIALYIPEINTLIAADAAEVPFPFARYSKDMGEMIGTLENLTEMMAETVLYCHAPDVTSPQLLHDNLIYFQKLEQHCRVALTSGKIPAEFDDELDLEVLIGYGLADNEYQSFGMDDFHESYRTMGHRLQIKKMIEYLRLESGD